MKAHTDQGTVVKVAVGYVRVSTLEQASEGVSLDAQRDKIRAYCKAHERYHLLSVCGMVNTHNAAGRMLMLNLANYAQFEREIISERTYEAMQHLKAQGVKMGHPPYGYVFSQVLDEHGRRSVVPLASEQALIERMAALHDAGFGFADIARQLTTEGIRARRGGEWRSRVISVILQREGRYTVRPHKEYAPRVPIVRDKAAAAARARELRAEGLSLRAIGTRLRKDGLLPPRARTWHAATVQHLLRYHGEPDTPDAARRAAELREQGLSLSEIGLRLSSEGVPLSDDQSGQAPSTAKMVCAPSKHDRRSASRGVPGGRGRPLGQEQGGTATPAWLALYFALRRRFALRFGALRCFLPSARFSSSRIGLTSAHVRYSSRKRELAAECEDRTKAKERLGKAEDEKSANAKEIYLLRRQVERLLRRLQRTESQARKKEAELDRVQVDLAAARRRHERQTAEQEAKLREAQSQLRELARVRDDLEKQIQTLAAQVEKHRSHEELARRREELIQGIGELTARAEALERQVDQAEQDLKKHEEELERQRQEAPPDQGGPGTPRSLVDLLRRRLEDEQARHIAAEKRIEQLLSEIANPDKGRRTEAPPPSTPPPVAPGQYQRHAIAAGYDFTRDPLLALMRHEVLVSDRYADWQARRNLRRGARRRDVEQTIDEQAYAAAMAARWRLIDHPHLRLGVRPMWSLLGCILDEQSERYLLTITQERIDEMASLSGHRG